MKQFTIKDFIKYNNPCAFCGEQKILKIISHNVNAIKFNDHTYLNLIVFNKMLEINLVISYFSSLKLRIIQKNNKFSCSNYDKLINYLMEHKVYLLNECPKCKIKVYSHDLEFQMEKKIIKPISIKKESIHIMNGDSFLKLESLFDEKISSLIITKNLKITALKFPIIPLNEFKNKNHFLSKIKTIITFS